MYPPPFMGRKLMHNNDVLQKIDSEQYCLEHQALEQEVSFLLIVDPTSGEFQRSFPQFIGLI